jgi:cell division protein FtsB
MVRKNRQVLTPQLVIRLLVVLILIAVISLILGDYGFYSYWKLRQQEKNARLEQEYLRNVEQQKAAERDRLDTDIRYIEKIAREKYRMSKKGENVYRVIDKSNDSTNPDPE